MSKRDKYHDTVKQALIHEGWTITHDPYLFQTDPKLATDLGAERLFFADNTSAFLYLQSPKFSSNESLVS